MTRNIIAQDSSFGMLNTENINKAYLYSTSKNFHPFLRYTVFEKINNSYVKIWDIDESNVDNTSFPVLESGIVLNKIKENGENHSIEDYKTLRIVNKNIHSLDSFNINFKFEDNKWIVKSREKITTDSSSIYFGYCIDTTYLGLNSGEVDMPKNRIDFMYSFTNLESNWKCNK